METVLSAGATSRKGGIVNEQMSKGRKLSDLPREEQVLLKKLAMPDRLVEIINQLEDKGVDVEAQLRTIRAS